MMTATMRAFVIHGAGQASVEEVPRPTAGAGEVVVDVERVGLCGTDREFFSGHMAYLASSEATYPIRIGHEWTGTVAAVGNGVDRAWVGRRVVGDTMLGCGRCARCLAGRQHLCADRFEVGIRHGWAGALAEQLLVPASSLYEIPETIDRTGGALVEPAANAWRAVQAADVGTHETLLVIGAGTIGLLAALIARASGTRVTIAGRSDASITFARSLGFAAVAASEIEADRRFDGVIDASTDPAATSFAVDHVEPGRRVACIGIAAEPSRLDTRRLVLGEISAVGVLSGSGGQAGAIALFASGAVDAGPLVCDVVALDAVAGVLAGESRGHTPQGPKIHVDPRVIGTHVADESRLLPGD
jgi:2-desacetyl-2-hydroxyethyl bacteriochlorophyllide A dehydrogenase